VPEDWGIKHENKTVGTEGEPGEYNNPRYAVSIFIPQTFVEEYRANEKQNQAFDKRRYHLEIGAFIVAAIYAALTFGLWRAANKQVIAAQAALRPWVSAVDDPNMAYLLSLDFSKPNQVTLQYGLDIPLKNFGKTPATDVVPTATIIWGPYKEIQPRLDMLGQYKCGPHPLLDLFQSSGFGSFIPPEGQIFYPSPNAETLFGKEPIKQGTLVQFYLVVCMAYRNSNDIPPSVHHTCNVERFRSADPNQGDIPAIQGPLKGKFTMMNGGCAN
jgi:hypothetical protein